MDWAGQAPKGDLGERVPQLADEDMNSLYQSFRALPAESRKSMRITWAKRDTLRRVDEATDLHPSWMKEALRNEPPALFLLALGELSPDLARSVLRDLWPQIRPKQPGDAVADVRPLSPAHAGAFRRKLFAPYVHFADLEREDELHPLLSFTGAEIWLMVQELGRCEVEVLAESGSASVTRLLAGMSPTDSARMRKWLGLPQVGDIGPGPEPETNADPDLERSTAYIRASFSIGGDDNQIVGLIGLAILAEALGSRPIAYTQAVAQRMSYDLTRHLFHWQAKAATALTGKPVDGTAYSADFVEKRTVQIRECMNVILKARRKPGRGEEA